MARLPTIWYDPLSLSARMSRFLDALFPDFPDLAYLDVFPGFGHTDIYLKDKTLVIETELPGARKEDIQVRVEDNRLVISGEIRRYAEVRDEHYIRMGRHYGAFHRVFPLPEEVEDKRAIRAKFENGVLRVEIPLRRVPETEGVFDVRID